MKSDSSFTLVYDVAYEDTYPLAFGMDVPSMPDRDDHKAFDRQLKTEVSALLWREISPHLDEGEPYEVRSCFVIETFVNSSDELQTEYHFPSVTLWGNAPEKTEM